MSRNTAALVAAFQAAPPVPAGSRERVAVDQIKALVPDVFPQLDAQTAGHALMHVVSLYNSVIDALRATDPLLDWESLTTLSHNILGVAGMELYTGTELGR